MTGTRSESTLLFHKVCKSQLTNVRGGPLFCDVCGSVVGPSEMAEADNTPSPFSG